MYRIAKQFEFSASHQLNNLPFDHPCGRLHGHNYVVVVELESAQLDDVGFVRDYGELKIVKDYLDRHFDHRHLNDVMLVNPTAENLAKTIFMRFKDELPELASVRVSETPKTWAEYRLEVGLK